MTSIEADEVDLSCVDWKATAENLQAEVTRLGKAFDDIYGQWVALHIQSKAVIDAWQNPPLFGEKADTFQEVVRALPGGWKLADELSELAERA